MRGALARGCRCAGDYPSSMALMDVFGMCIFLAELRPGSVGTLSDRSLLRLKPSQWWRERRHAHVTLHSIIDMVYKSVHKYHLRALEPFWWSCGGVRHHAAQRTLLAEP